MKKKKIKSIALSLVLAIIVVAAMIYCCENYPTSFSYTYEIEVKYLDGRIDTILTSYKSLRENPVYFTLQIEENAVFSSDGSTPCLTLGNGLDHTIIAVGVNDFRVISEIKEVVDE